MECSGVFPTPQFACKKGLGTCAALLCVSHTLQSALESGQEVRIVQIDFCAPFDRVSNQGILYRLCSVGIGYSLLSILALFLQNQQQHVMMDSRRSKLLNVVSGVPMAVFWARNNNNNNNRYNAEVSDALQVHQLRCRYIRCTADTSDLQMHQIPCRYMKYTEDTSKFNTLQMHPIHCRYIRFTTDTSDTLQVHQIYCFATYLQGILHGIMEM